MRPRRLRRIGTCLGLAVALSGCGGASGGPGAAGGVTSGADGLLDFVRCMRRHGIPLADPVRAGDDKVEIRPAEGQPLPPRTAFDAATAACEREGHRQFGNRSGAAEQLDSAAQDRALAFARCVRRAGVDLPDPRFDGGTVTNWDPDRLGIDLGDPAVIALGQRCARDSGFDPWREL